VVDEALDCVADAVAACWDPDALAVAGVRFGIGTTEDGGVDPCRLWRVVSN